MGILNKNEIKKAIKDKEVTFEPEIDQFQLQPNSLDLRVGWNFYVPEKWQYNEAGRVVTRPDYLNHDANANNFRLIKLKPGQYFEFLPNEFVIVSTLEKITLNSDHLIALMYPRSSMIRRGLVIEGGVVDLHYKGSLMIPIFNGTSQPLKLYPGERAYQLVFHTLDGAMGKEDAQVHGVAKAKYHESTDFNLESRTDSKDEVEFIKEGKISEIKTNYKVDLG